MAGLDLLGKRISVVNMAIKVIDFAFISRDLFTNRINLFFRTL